MTRKHFSFESNQTCTSTSSKHPNNLNLFGGGMLKREGPIEDLKGNPWKLYFIKGIAEKLHLEGLVKSLCKTTKTLRLELLSLCNL